MISISNFAHSFMMAARPYYHPSLKQQPQYGALNMSLSADRSQLIHYIANGVDLSDVGEEEVQWLAEIITDEQAKKNLDLELFKRQHL